MKRITLTIFCVLLLNSCKSKNEEQKAIAPKFEKSNYTSFGKMLDTNDAKLGVAVASIYRRIQVRDSIHIKIITRVNDVCQAKGCWMRLRVDDDNEIMVKFKDYAFFVPKEIIGKDVVVNGKAFVKEVSVEEQRHYAEDAGKSKDEIAEV
jgi:hypothetical protein